MNKLILIGKISKIKIKNNSKAMITKIIKLNKKKIRVNKN
jgi:hypothetical protein